MNISSWVSRCPGFLRRPLARVLATPLGGRLARGAFWSLLGTSLSKGLATLSWIIAGRMLGKESFGELNMVQNTVGLFGAAAGLGMGMAAAKYVAEYRRTDPARAGRFIGLAGAATWITSGVLALALWLLAPWLARETLGAPHLASWLALSSLLLFFSGVAGAQQGVLAGFEAFKSIAVISIATGLVSFPLLLLGAHWGGVLGALWALIAAALLNCLLNFIHLRRHARAQHIVIGIRGCLSEARVFWDFNLPGMLNTLLSAAAVWAVGAMLVRHSSSFGGLGIYNAVQRMKLVPENMAAMLLAPMLPVLSETFARKDMAAYGRTLRVSYTVAGLVIIPAALVQISAPWLTLLPFGAEYRSGEPLVLWIMLTTLTYALLWPMGNIFISMGRIWFALLVGTLHNALICGLAWWLIPRQGAAGLALAAAVSLMLANVPSVLLLKKNFPGLLREVRWGRMTALVLALVLVCEGSWHFFTPAQALLTGLAAAGAFVFWLLPHGTPPARAELPVQML
ncbi:oligosaccharide flippase family protein [Prosthecobacter sp.]|uniref:oligosaccharide flippase family protein n=1 Tax=Prosthecobacter sp. TaxID=1965333 RepID=UPI003784986E